jgi:1-phosphatidylinositol-4-phosphate 5-kinase
MHGVGALVSADGVTAYRGSFFAGEKRGLGRQTFANGDAHEGLWKDGVPHGPGTYAWASGDEYNGEFRDGAMSGWGTLVFFRDGGGDGGGDRRGDRHDGEWEDGLEHGNGVYTWHDTGATFSGTWRRGKKHGVGIWAPSLDKRKKKQRKRAGERATRLRRAGSIEGGKTPGSAAARRLFEPSEEEVTGEVDTDEDTEEEEEEEEEENGGGGGGGGVSVSIDEDDVIGALAAGAPVVKHRHRGKKLLLCEYDDGKLIREEIIEADVVRGVNVVGGMAAAERASKGGGRYRAAEAVFAAAAAVTAPRAKMGWLQARRTPLAGETIYKGHKSYELMVQLQVGVRWSIGRGEAPSRAAAATAAATTAELITPAVDATRKIKQSFPRGGSASTPPHPAGDFKWKDYAPGTFKSLRKRWGIDVGDFMLSLCGDAALRELPSPGKSGSVFYLSHDDKFIVKTMRKHEAKTLIEALPRYHAHVSKSESTLLTKFFGLYRVKTPKGRKVRFIVMANLFRTELPIHRVYDLKGSTHGRYTKGGESSAGPGVTLKDLDLAYAFRLDVGARDKLSRTLREDCRLLEEMKVMDYSLLVGVHFRDVKSDDASSGSGGGATRRDDDEEATSPLTPPSDDGDGDGDVCVALRRLSSALSSSSERRRSFGHLDDVLSTAPTRTSDARPVPGAFGGGDHIALAAGEKEVRLGVNTVAVAVPSSLRRAPTPVAEEDEDEDEPRAEGHVEEDGGGGCGGAGPGPGLADARAARDAARDVVLHLGIIDILQEYNGAKRMESALRGSLHGRGAISAVDPVRYSRRFQRFLGKVFE